MDLKRSNVALEESEKKYRGLSVELEQRVAARTSDLAAANKELESFSYSVSHDLRAPLRSIDGFSFMLLEECGARLDDAGKDYLRRVRNAVSRMDSLIGSLLQLSKLGRVEMKRERIDLSELARTVAAELMVAEGTRQVELRIQDGLVAEADSRLMRAVLENLLGNALKYTGRQTVATIEFGVEQEGQPAGFFVRDNGAGFDQTYAGKLFIPFARLHSEAEFPGTGVGLATVRRIVQRHGGQVWAKGTPGQGAAFYWTLPPDGDGGQELGT
jgi:light-regulated signal transduction histidine kinase (bacteriophytochrome)